MENGPPTKPESESEKPEGTSDGLIKYPPSESTESAVSVNLSPSTTPATTLKGSKKTWTSVELEELKSKAGLVAGVLSDFQTAKGMIARSEVVYTLPSGRNCKAIKILLFVPDFDLVAVKTTDGLVFDLLAVEEK